MSRHIGGSILPSNNPQILQPLVGIGGTLQVRALAEQDTHALFLNDRQIAEHANGFSCRNLAERTVRVWAGTRPAEYALDQFDYILRCGGSGDRGAVLQMLSVEQP